MGIPLYNFNLTEHDLELLRFQRYLEGKEWMSDEKYANHALHVLLNKDYPAARITKHYYEDVISGALQLKLLLQFANMVDIDKTDFKIMLKTMLKTATEIYEHIKFFLEGGNGGLTCTGYKRVSRPTKDIQDNKEEA